MLKKALVFLLALVLITSPAMSVFAGCNKCDASSCCSGKGKGFWQSTYNAFSGKGDGLCDDCKAARKAKRTAKKACKKRGTEIEATD